MKNIYEGQYKKMPGSVPKPEILRKWNGIGAYMAF